jgi:hypothetical protein
MVRIGTVDAGRLAAMLKGRVWGELVHLTCPFKSALTSVRIVGLAAEQCGMYT